MYKSVDKPCQGIACWPIRTSAAYTTRWREFKDPALFTMNTQSLLNCASSGVASRQPTAQVSCAALLLGWLCVCTLLQHTCNNHEALTDLLCECRLGPRKCAPADELR